MKQPRHITSPSRKLPPLRLPTGEWRSHIARAGRPRRRRMSKEKRVAIALLKAFLWLGVFYFAIRWAFYLHAK